MITGAKWELVTHLWHGPLPLPDQLLYWHSADVPAEAMARLVTLETGVRMNGETVRRWVRTLSASAA